MSVDFIYKIIGGYKIIDLLGSGGMAEVYRAIDLQSGKVVAIKILKEEKLKGRFLNEAKVHSQLKHKNITEMYELTEFEGKPCIIMEYVQGNDLDELIKYKGRLSIDEAMNIFNQLLSAIIYLHKKGIIHRDLKPGNIKVKSGGEVKLMDFGIAKDPYSPKLTIVGFAIGTIEYMSPEQLFGTPGKTSDIWSLGVLLFEMITGKLPFSASNTNELKAKIIKGRLPSVLQMIKYDNKYIVKIIKNCLVKDYKRRISEDKLKKLADKYFENKSKKNLSEKTGVINKYYWQFAKAYDTMHSSLKTFESVFFKIVAGFMLLVTILIVIVLIFSKSKEVAINNAQSIDSLTINVVNTSKAKIILENGQKYALPYVLKKEKNKEAIFIIKAQGYKEKKITLGAIPTRKSFDYVLEKEK